MTREIRSTKRLGVYIGLLALGGWIGVIGGYLFARVAPPTPTSATSSFESLPVSPSASIGAPLLPPAPLPEGDRDLNFIARAAEQVGPAVVRIDALRTSRRQRAGDDSRSRNPLRRFFGRDSEPESPAIPPTPSGAGSGFIVSADGRILTNAHVVEGADSVRVTLRDGRTLEGRVIGSDPVTDVAAIAVETESELPTVRFGRSAQLVPGDWAIAIGNPLGLNHTVTVGIVSALDRSSAEVGIRNKRVRFIQTDAAINPGNSGGPLLDAAGNVVGINTAIRANAQGLGFAIPIETAARIADELFATGRADHPYLGIQMIGLSPELRERLNAAEELPEVTLERGVLIVSVIPDSPADAAGLRRGDVLLRVGEQPVITPVEVQERVERSEIGVPLTVEVNRDGAIRSFEISPGVLPADP